MENQRTKNQRSTAERQPKPGAKLTENGFFVLVNKKGETVRFFRLEAAKLVVVYRHDNRRIEVLPSIKELEDAQISFDILAESTPAKVRKDALAISGGGEIRFIHEIGSLSPSYDLVPDKEFNTKKAIGWGACVQVSLAGILMLTSLFGGGQKKETEVQVTLLDKATVEKMIADEQIPTQPTTQPTPPTKQPEQHEVRQKAVERAPAPVAHKKIIVAPSETKITKHTPVPTRSTSTRKTAHKVAHPHSSIAHGGGYKSDARRGYGTNEQNMNSIGALGALNSPRVKGGNGGSGGLNLQAVGNEAGSGAGGKGYGGFGSNGGGGHGKGGLGTGKGMGLSNAMYGKGLIAAPFGDGSPAPGSGGYGTRGRAGGGAQGAGYGTTTVVGSWKGTGPKGNGPAGSGSGSGDPNGSPWGSADGDDDDAIVTGGLDRDQIAEVIARNLGQITYCYEQGLQRHANLAGRVSVRFQIGAQGRVQVANVNHSTVHSAQVESCITGKLKTWMFPRPQGGVTVAVTYPFVLRRNLAVR